MSSSPSRKNNTNINQQNVNTTMMHNRHKKKKSQRYGGCNGPRVQYTFVDSDDLRVSPVSPLSMKKRIIKTVVGENPGSRRTGHYKTTKRGKSLYMVSLPQHYRTVNYIHYSKRRPGSLKNMKKKMVRQNSFFSPKSQLRPGSAPLNRHHPSLHLRKQNSYNVLVDEYLKSPINANNYASSGSEYDYDNDEDIINVVDIDNDIVYDDDNDDNNNNNNKREEEKEEIISPSPSRKTRQRPQSAHPLSKHRQISPPSSPVMHSKRYGFNYTPDSPLHRAMSHSERHSLRPQTATLVRRKSKIELRESKSSNNNNNSNNNLSIRPKSASATSASLGGIAVRKNGKTTKMLTIDTNVNDIYTKEVTYGNNNNTRKNNNMRPYLRHKYKDTQRWKAEFNPQILNKYAAIPTSRGYRKITKILKVKPKKKKNGRRRMIKSRSSGYIRKPLRRPQSAGAQPGGTFPISTRYPPHYPVKISMYEQLKQIGFPAKEDV